MGISMTDDQTYLTPPTSFHGPMAVGLVAVAVLIIVVGFFGFQTTLAGAIVTNGTIAVDGRTRKLEHLEGGIIETIHVRDGDLVGSGDQLITLDTTEITTQLAITESRLVEWIALKFRLESERDGLSEFGGGIMPEVKLSVELQDQIIASQKRLFSARRDIQVGEIKQLGTRIAQIAQQSDGIDASRVANERQLALVERDLAGKRQLVDQNLIRQPEIIQLEREAAGIEGKIAEIAVDKARLGDAIAEVEIQKLQVDRNFLNDVLAEHREAESEINKLQETRRALAAILHRAVIVSPESGFIHGLMFTTPGEVVGPGSTLLELVPDSGTLLVEVRVSPSDIDQLYEGQEATVRLSAFNQSTTPELKGTLRNVSPNSFEDPVTAEAFFEAFVHISAGELQRLGKLRLQPGMPAEVFLKTDDRSPISFLLKPLSDQLWRTFRGD